MIKIHLRFHVITIFPGIFDSYLNESLFRRATKNKIISVQMYDLRDFSDARYNTKPKKGCRSFAQVDDRPFGGGPGMVLKVEPIYRAVEFVKRQGKGKIRTILFSTRGKKFDAKVARRLAKYDELIFICGRYEGVDERVAEYIADEEISIGDYVLSGGEIPALVVVESVSRYISGFLGKKGSLEETNGSFPTYTRPEVFSLKKGKKWSVPKVLLSGDHKKIEEWRKRFSSEI
jgi:tRNA (guanine37-N1)-methyltransferase